MKPNLPAEFVGLHEQFPHDRQPVQPAGIIRIEQDQQRNFVMLRQKLLRDFVSD